MKKSLVDVIKELTAIKEEVDLFCRGSLIVGANLVERNIFNPTLPLCLKERIASDVLKGKARGERKVGPQGMPKRFQSTIFYGVKNGRKSLEGPIEQNTNKPLVYLFPEEADITARFYVGLVPHESPEFKKFRNRDFFDELKTILRYPADKAAVEHCQSKYSGMDDFDFYFNRAGLKRLRRAMYSELIKPYMDALAIRTAKIFEEAGVDKAHIAVEEMKSYNPPHQGKKFLYVLKQKLATYQEADDVLHRAVRLFGTESYGLKEGMKEPKFYEAQLDFKDAPENLGILELFPSLTEKKLWRREF